MKNYLQLIIVFLFFTLLSSCQKEFLDPNPNSVKYDSDATIFLNSAGITDSIEKVAVNNLVIQLKNSSLWQKFIAIYPMVGGNSVTTGYNLIDPRNLDIAYRLTFYGDPLFTGKGVLFQSLADYADTHLADSAIGACTDASISYYSGTQNSVSGYDMGCTDGAFPSNELSIYSDSSDNSQWFGFSQSNLSPNTTGLFMLSSSETNVTRYRNGVIVNSKGSPPENSYTNVIMLIGKSRETLHAGKRECEFATIGHGLTDAESLTFYTIVQQFETELGR